MYDFKYKTNLLKFHFEYLIVLDSLKRNTILLEEFDITMKYFLHNIVFSIDFYTLVVNLLSANIVRPVCRFIFRLGDRFLGPVNVSVRKLGSLES